MSKLKLKVKKENFSDFLSKLSDLTNIEDVIKFKIDKDYIFVYSIVISGDVNSIVAFKNYTLETKNYIENVEDIKNSFDFILKGAKRNIRSLSFIESSPEKIVMYLEYREIKDSDILLIQCLKFSSGKFKMTCIGDELGSIKDIVREKFETFLSPSNSKWNFSMSKEDFQSSKKLCGIHSDTVNLQLEIRSKKLYFSEMNKWEIEIGEIDRPNMYLIFDKKYLSNVNEDDTIPVFVYSTFLLISGKNSNLMISYEQDFNAED